ncbi:MAG: hypothetical protein ACRDF8_05435 [Chloroflexota bacterium]
MTAALLGAMLLVTCCTAPASVRRADAYMWVTGYSVIDYPGGGALGQNRLGETMACPRWELGTSWAIDGVGVRRCMDTYAAGLTDRFDILVPSRAAAYATTGCRAVWAVALGVPGMDGRRAIPDHHCDLQNRLLARLGQDE